MSKDMLGPLTRAMVGVPARRLGLMMDIANRLGSADAEHFFSDLTKFVRDWKSVVESPRTLATMIAEGKYDWVNSDITEANFPTPMNLVLGTEPKLFHFNRAISSENAIKEMDKEGYRPATIWDLLDYGAKNPELQRQFPIVALGSVCEVNFNRNVAYLGRGASERYLCLGWLGIDWDERCRFLAVRK